METSSNKHHLCDMHRSRRRRRRILVTAIVTAVLAGLFALTLYVVYRPMKPQASVARAAVYQLANAAGNNNSGPVSSTSPSPYALTASVQFTLMLHNPSDRATLLYDGLQAYATYRGEVVTPPATLPALVQERGADVALSPLLGGGGVAVPVSADAAGALAADCAARRVRLRFVVMGRVRYRTGPFSTGWRDLYVRCDVTLGTGGGRDVPPGGGGVGNVPLLECPNCFVDA